MKRLCAADPERQLIEKGGQPYVLTLVPYIMRIRDVEPKPPLPGYGGRGGEPAKDGIHIFSARIEVYIVARCENCGEIFSYYYILRGEGEWKEKYGWDKSRVEYERTIREGGTQEALGKRAKIPRPCSCPNCGLYQTWMLEGAKQHVMDVGIAVGGVLGIFGSFFMMLAGLESDLVDSFMRQLPLWSMCLVGPVLFFGPAMVGAWLFSEAFWRIARRSIKTVSDSKGLSAAQGGGTAKV